MAETTNPYPKPRFLAVVIAITGLVLLVLGGELIGAGGSFYYAIAGLALGACGVMLFRGDRRSAQLYGLFLLGTFAWAFEPCSTQAAAQSQVRTRSVHPTPSAGLMNGRFWPNAAYRIDDFGDV